MKRLQREQFKKWNRVKNFSHFKYDIHEITMVSWSLPQQLLLDFRTTTGPHQAATDHGDGLSSGRGVDTELPHHQRPPPRSQAAPRVVRTSAKLILVDGCTPLVRLATASVYTVDLYDLRYLNMNTDRHMIHYDSMSSCIHAVSSSGSIFFLLPRHC